MSLLDWIEHITGWAGGFCALVALGYVYIGVAQGLRRPAGLTTGRVPQLIRSPLFYVLASLLFIGLGWLLWRTLVVLSSPGLRIAALALGALLYFPGVWLAVWGRLTLGKDYFVSSGFGAQLFEGHRLVTRGPYALVRHPMYLGILTIGVGGLLIYRTWTLVMLALFFLALQVRARREEEALQAAFGEEWAAYARRVPRFFPRLRRK